MQHQLERGFSLIELITALIIFAILCGYSMSFMPSLRQKNQLQVMADELQQAIHFAKIEALTNAHTVTLTPLSEQDDWSSGMLLFVDSRTHSYSPGISLIREWHWHSPGVHVTWKGFESTGYLRFSPDLISRGCSGHFVVADKGLNHIKLVVNRLGRVTRVTF